MLLGFYLFIVVTIKKVKSLYSGIIIELNIVIKTFE